MSDQRRKRNESEEQRPSNALMFLPTSNFLNFFSTPITKSPRMLNDKKEVMLYSKIKVVTTL